MPKSFQIFLFLFLILTADFRKKEKKYAIRDHIIHNINLWYLFYFGTRTSNKKHFTLFILFIQK